MSSVKESSSFLFFILSYLCHLLAGCDFSIAHDRLHYILPQKSQNKAFYAIKEESQAFQIYFSYSCTHFLKIESYGEEGKVHYDLVFSKMSETFVCHVIFHLPENSLRLDVPIMNVTISCFI
jgi:hypothetical protein